MKRSWNKPQIIILVERSVDELILTGCKASGGMNSGGEDKACYSGGWQTTTDPHTGEQVKQWSCTRCYGS